MEASAQKKLNLRIETLNLAKKSFEQTCVRKAPTVNVKDTQKLKDFDEYCEKCENFFTRQEVLHLEIL